MKFDARIVNAGTGPGFGEKAKKDMFKKLISRLVGKDMAKLFKKEIVIKNLPTLVPLKVIAADGLGLLLITEINQNKVKKLV